MKLKKAMLVFLSLVMVASMSIPAFAAAEGNDLGEGHILWEDIVRQYGMPQDRRAAPAQNGAKEDTADEADSGVLAVLIVNDDGCFLYQGKDAQAAFERLQEAPTLGDAAYAGPAIIAPPMAIAGAPLGDSDIMFRGPFSYKYRFVPDAKNKTPVYGTYSIVSNSWGNGSDETQTSHFTFSVSATGSIKTELKGKYLEAVEASIGTEYSQTYSASSTIDYNVPARKRVWLQYKPEYTLYSGRSEKYFIPRGAAGPFRKEVVEESKPVRIFGAKKFTIPIGNKVLTVPAGAYVWCQDNDYSSQKPPKIKY